MRRKSSFRVWSKVCVGVPTTTPPSFTFLPHPSPSPPLPLISSPLLSSLLFTQEEEEELLELQEDLSNSTIEEAAQPAELAARWHSRGHAAVAPADLTRKLSNMRKIHAMLDRKGSEVFGVRGRSCSLQEDAQWEEETLAMVKRGAVDDFSHRMTEDRRASAVSDSRDRTALHHAAATGNLALVKLIGKELGDLDVRDKDGRTPLFFSLSSAQDDVSDWLVEEGALVALADAKGVTPLHVAAHTNNRHCVRVLLETGKVDVNAADEKGTTPLHVAAHRASSDVVETLIAAGADPKLKDRRGNLPCDLAARMDKRANTRRLTITNVATAVQAAVRFSALASPPMLPKAPPEVVA